jgi:hypothetical protein
MELQATSGGKRWGRNIVIGSGVGFAAGVVATAILLRTSTSEGVLGLTVYHGGVAGALVGAVAGVVWTAIN